MTSISTPFRVVSGHRLAGATLIVLGLVVMAGWLARLPSVVRLVPDYAPMVFNTALSFVLAGSALLLFFRAGLARFRAGLAAALVAMGTAVIAEHVLGLNLGIDQQPLHAWLHDANPAPGRMSGGTATAFLLAGSALLVSARRTGWAPRAAYVLTAAVGAIGVLGIAGYVVNAHLLFPDYPFAGVALHTAIGLLVLAAGLHSTWRSAWGERPLFRRDDDRIAFVGAAVLVTVALGAGLATFAILQGRVQTLVRDGLLAEQARRAEMFLDLLELREANARIAATRPAATRNLRVIHAGRDDGSHIENIRAVAESFVSQGFSAISYLDVDGKVVASAGAFAGEPQLAVRLSTRSSAELSWVSGFVLRHRLPVRDAAGAAGEVVTEQPLPALTRLAEKAPGAGRTWDMGLCERREERLACFPQRLNPRAFSTPLVNAADEALPMTRALRGETATIITRDYRSQNVVAAYGPVGDVGLGMVVKVDTAEVFLPIRQQLEIALGLLLALVAAGTVLLRSRVRPLATKVVEAEQRYRAVAETASDAIISADARGNVAYVNEAAHRIFGYAAGEMLGRPLTTLMPAAHRDAHRAGMARFLASGEARIIGKTVELTAQRRDGSTFPMEISVASWKTDEGVFFTAILRDIAHRKLAQEELDRRSAQLEAANKELEAFSYSVSHDLRAPLRHIAGYADLLKEDASALDDTGRRYLGVIVDSVRRMGRLIDDLLEFSRMGRVDLRRERVDMDRLAVEARDALQRELAPGRSVEWRLGALGTVRGDAATLRQVWVNLLSNALKYTRGRDPARIEVSARREEGEMRFFVTDNGAGFDMRYADKLFGVFQRLHRQEEFEGTGVGLANVRRIVARHGGRTWAEGRPGEGATFHFSIPDSLEEDR